MSATLLAVVIALTVGHLGRGATTLRNFEWFLAWSEWLAGHRSRTGGGWGLALVVLPPVVLVALVQWSLAPLAYGLLGFVFAVAVLFYSWGPRDLDVDVEAVVEASDPVARQVTLQRLHPGLAAPGFEPPVLVDAVFHAALRRWFGVLLWFLLLGPAGALGYRLIALCAEGAGQAALGAPERAAAAWVLRVLDWPVAQLMTLALALVGDFDRVIGAWREWHVGGPSLDIGFLGAAARVSVDSELAEEPVEVLAAEPLPADAAPGSIAALRDAMSLVWRVLLLWLAVLALFVLAGYVG